jgi:hypothetical protein
MANHGNKFVSANLNKSYGQQSHFHHPSYNGSSYGQAAAGRGRPSHAGGGGGSGMVVLSRPRSSHKAMPKLSVPPPLNLPSIRKEHEKFDLSGSGGGAAGGSGSGTGSHLNSTSMGWTKPGIVKDETGDSQVVNGLNQSVVASDSVSNRSTAYVQPLAHLGGFGGSQPYPSRVEKAMVLRGEDFPSLQAAMPLPATSTSVQKQKDGSQKKNQQLVSEDEGLSANEQSDSYRLSSPARMGPQGQSSYPRTTTESKENGFNRFGGGPRMSDQPRKPDYFPGPLPLVRVNPRSDWADDERDTGHGFGERGRESKTEAYWDREFELPRTSLLPHKPPNNNLFERPGPAPRREETGKSFSSDILKIENDTQRDSRTPSREGSESKTWRSSAVQKDAQQTSNDRNDLGRSNVMESKYMPPPFTDKGNRDSTYARTDLGHGQNWNNNSSSFNSRGSDRNTRDRYGGEQSSNFNKFNGSKSSFSSSVSKGFSTNEPNFSREKRVYSKTEKPYAEDPFAKDFGSTGYDGGDPFSAGLVGVIKRRKDAVKPNDFHDPVRESFEAELERVQKMQEMERQRIIDEQERAIEQARREEEERQRMVREEEERQRRMEEEAREAAWRAEQERLEAIQKAEELKIAREEEKRRIFIEEERRKEAAKQKLLELEARIARRQAETSTKDDNSTPVSSREVDLDSWEDGERMVERITTSASSDSHVSNRPFDMNPRSHPSIDGSSSGFVDGGKFVNSSWRRDTFENGNTSSFPRKDFYGGPGYMQHPRPPYFKGGVVQEPHGDDFAPQGWSPYGDAESEFYENVGDRYGIGWGQGQRWYPSRETDDFYTYGRPRFSMRQPRVLPPPSLPSIHKGSDSEVPGPSNSEETVSHYHNESRSESQGVENNDRNLEKDSTPRCDSQSSLSVSSPPTSPTQLSHDELEESRISTAEGKEETDLYNESGVLNENGGKEADLESSVTGGEDEEWTVDNNEELQEQEEYDEDEDGYQEEDEVHEVYDDMIREFKEDLEGKDTSHHMNNLVLGFDEGVEVGIPSDELEQDSRNEEVMFRAAEVSGSIPEVLQVDETEKAVQDSNPSVIAPQTSTTPLLDNIVSSSAEMAAVSSVSSGSSSQNQADLPLKLQFGLFSGPSLIPSPVPAIQIGSIQMPLHLHPPVGSSIGHNHSSQAPLFQFGQLRYTSPVSQGILPMPFVQPNLQQTHYNLNQNIQQNQATSGHNLVQNNDNNGGARNNASIPKVETQISSTTDDKAKTGSNTYEQSSQTGEKDYNSSRNQGSSYINKGKKVAYSVKNPGFRSSFRSSDDPRVDSSGFQRRPQQRAIQRTEFRVRDSSNKNPSTSSISSSSDLDVVKSHRNGRGVGIYGGTGYKRGNVPNKAVKQIVESESSVSGSQEMDSGKRIGKERIIDNSKEDVDAPLQSQFVRVYEQSGIEAPSDEDDFIEVRSKRQMLNDRREQREKEIKAKARLTKPPRKPRTSSSSTVVSNKVSAASNNIKSDFVGSVKKDSSSRFTTIISQPLAPIGTPSPNSDSQTNTRLHSLKPIEAGSASVMSAPAKDLNSVLDNVQTSLGSWGNVQINQQVMSLTQTQLDEAMKLTSVAEPSSSSSPSVLAKDKSISQSSSPISSLLAGEKIQFGAVTSPTVLPPSSRVISHVIGAPGAFRSDTKTSHNNLSQTAENDLFFGKKDKPNESSHLEDSEAEAEAAASAVAAAAISTDEIVLPDNTKTFRDTHSDAIAGGGGQQSRGDESLSVSLPADLSVETHPISLWPALPSPQASPNQILSHFPGAPPPSHFPFYDMNSMLSGGPIFTFGPSEESSGTQSQSQKTAMSASAPPAHIGNWHSPVDSFYGPPAGFAGPFISPPGGIPGVQPPPHMVVYNHYAPVGQFGQVGLSFMGTTYIPSGKQPDWKHNPGSPSMDNNNNVSNSNNMNIVSGHRNNNNAPNMASPNAAMPHHLAPRSPILPMASPMAMFDVSPFQSAADMSVQARWSHIPAPPLHSVPMQQQPQQGEVGVLPHHPQFNHIHHHHHIDAPSLPPPLPERFSEPQSSSVPPDKPPVITKTQSPNELGLVTDSSTVTGTSTDAASTAAVVAQSGNNNIGSGSGQNANNNNNGFKNQQQKNMTGHHHQHHHNQYNNNNHSGYGYNNQRGSGGGMGVSQKSGDWGTHRRSGGFHGRNQSLGADKNFPNTKMKQVYVAKQTRSGPSTVE